MAAAVATDPYSSTKIQLGTCQGCPSVDEYQTKKTERMLSVQIVRGSVDRPWRNGISQSRYQGYTTGANANEAAIGHAHVSREHTARLLRSHIAASRPNKTAKPVAIWGRSSRSNVAKIGS